MIRKIDEKLALRRQFFYGYSPFNFRYIPCNSQYQKSQSVLKFFAKAFLEVIP